MDELKQAKNLFKKLINNQDSAVYSADKTDRTLLDKARKSAYEKDKVFYKIYNELEDNKIIFDDEKTRIPFYTPFIEQKKDIYRLSALYSINAPLQFFHADIADIRFFQSQQVIQSTCYSALIYSRLKLTFIQ